MITNGIVRVLQGYEKNGENLAVEIPISSVPLEFLQKLFGERSDDLMYYCYKLDKDKAMALQKIINKQIDLEHYDFYLDCHLSV